jgi:hypothetical protein
MIIWSIEERSNWQKWVGFLYLVTFFENGIVEVLGHTRMSKSVQVARVYVQEYDKWRDNQLLYWHVVSKSKTRGVK